MGWAAAFNVLPENSKARFREHEPCVGGRAARRTFVEEPDSSGRAWAQAAHNILP